MIDCLKAALSSEVAFLIALVSGYLALLVMFVWTNDPHCFDCPTRNRKEEGHGS